jgi:hypothetical protein
MAVRAIAFGGFFAVIQSVAFAQCKEKQHEITNKPVHYQDIPLKGTKVYVTLSGSGEERLFSYHNEEIDLIFHAQNFTEVRFTSKKGRFSIFTTSLNRTRWNPCFVLAAPLTERDIEKLRGTEKIEILLPEDHRIYELGDLKSDLFTKALSCLD